MSGQHVGQLPQPTGGFVLVQAAAGPLLTCAAMPAFARHFFTTRPWRLGSRSNRDEEAWQEVADEIGVPPANLGRMHQVHGAAVVRIMKGAAGERAHADIAVTDDSAVAATVQTADCVPLLLADTRRHVVAAAHAGWRGLAARVPQVAVGVLVREFGCAPEDIVAAIGPSIRACCYEVGADVRVAFTSNGFSDSDVAAWFFEEPQPDGVNPSMRSLPHHRRADHWFFDSAAVARDQLERAGVPRDRIHAAGLCTASHPDLFCSYRRDGKGAGRMAGVVRLSR